MAVPAAAVVSSVALALAGTGVVASGLLAGPAPRPAAAVDPRPAAAVPGPGSAAIAGTPPGPPPAVEPPPAPRRAAIAVRYTWPLRPPRPVRPFAPGPQPWSPGHRGIDLAGAAGAPVLAAAAGSVAFAGPVAGRPVVVVAHPDGVRTTYEPVRPSVRPGDRVGAGAPLGVLEAAAGHCDAAPCLHWGALLGDVYLDPLSLLRLGPPVLLPLYAARPAEGPPAGPGVVRAVTGPAGGRRATWSALYPPGETTQSVTATGRRDRSSGNHPWPPATVAMAPTRAGVSIDDRESGWTMSVSRVEADPASAGSVIAVSGLWKVFGPRPDRVLASAELSALGRRELMERHGNTVAVRDVSFEVAPGEVFVVMGLSGSGKSTLVRCLTRLVEPTAGTVRFEGENLLTAGEKRLRHLRRHKFSMVFQNFGLLPHRRVLDNVAYGLEVRGTPRAERVRRAMEVIELVGLSGFEHGYPEELSGGMQQRVGLARALAGEPDVLFFDEPFSALDPLIRRDMQNEVARLHRELGKTMLFVTHDLSEALRLGDRILIMRDGETVQLGTPDELVGAPADDYVRQFVQDVPRADVLTLRWVMRPARPDDEPDGPHLAPDVVVRDAVRPVLAADGRPAQVVADGEVLGVVGEEEILALLGGRADTAPDQPRAPVDGDDGGPDS